MSSKTERITRALKMHGIMETSDIAEHTNIKAHIVEQVLRKMEDSGDVFAISDDEWQLN